MKPPAIKRCTITTFFTILLLSISGYAYAEPPHSDTTIFTVGFAQDTLANDWRVAQVNDLRSQLSQYPNIKLIVKDAGGNSARQIQDIEALAQRKVDVLVTSPRNGAASTPAIAKIYQQGIPVVLMTRRIMTEDYTTLVTPNDYQIASNAAEFMVKKLNGKGKILILRGVPTATTAIARTQGFLDTIKKHPGIEVTAIKNGNYLRGDAMRAVESVLSEGTEFDAIYAQSDSMASGARLVLKKHDISPHDKVIVGIDYIKEARDAIRSGEQSASFLYPTCAQETADIIVKIMKGGPVPKIVSVASLMITAENVDRIEPIF